MSFVLAICIFFGWFSVFFAAGANTPAAFILYTTVASICITIAFVLIAQFVIS